MQHLSYTKALLEHWGVAVEDIPTSDAGQKQEADFLASFGDVRVLIEEKTKEGDPSYLVRRADEQALKHEQKKELEQLRYKVSALLDRAVKLHQREFDMLPEVVAARPNRSCDTVVLLRP